MVGDVKALINLKDGTIQLEGPKEFVEKYLDKYDIMIKNSKTFTPLSPNKEKPEAEEAPKRTRVVRPKAGPACGEKISELISEGFFKEQRTREEVQKKLLEKGLRYESGIISATLNNFFKSGKIEKTGVGRNAKYYSNV
jgi:hypothetical protein